MKPDNDIDQLIACAQGRLSAAERQAVDALTAQDPHAKDLLDLFVMLKQNLEPGDAYVPSPKIWDFLAKHNALAAQPKRVAKVPVIARFQGTLRELINILIPPIHAPQTVAAGQRGAEGTPDLVFTTERLEISLNIAATGKPNQRRILGEVTDARTHKPVISARVELQTGNRPAVKARVDKNTGDFLFDGIFAREREVFDLRIELDDQECYIENLPLGLAHRL